MLPRAPRKHWLDLTLRNLAWSCAEQSACWVRGNARGSTQSCKGYGVDVAVFRAYRVHYQRGRDNMRWHSESAEHNARRPEMRHFRSSVPPGMRVIATWSKHFSDHDQGPATEWLCCARGSRYRMAWDVTCSTAWDCAGEVRGMQAARFSRRSGKREIARRHRG